MTPFTRRRRAPHPSAPRNAAFLAATMFLLLGLATSCGLIPSRSSLLPDQPPTITLTSGPVDTLSSPQSWIVDIAWTASDPDGPIDRFEYAVDPPTLQRARFALADTVWVTTHEQHVTIRFRAASPDSLGPGATASDFHVFLLRAIDKRGGVSPLIVRAFYAYTVAPDVQILRPVPSGFFSAMVPVPFRIEWRGHDPDGVGTGEPAAYRVRLLDLAEPGVNGFLLDPDSLFRQGMRTGWVDWRTVSASTPWLDVQESDGFVAGKQGLAVVLAVDDAGATTPYVTFDRNLLWFQVTSAESGSPRIHLWSALFDYQYASGGYSLDPLRQIPIELGAGQPLTLHWEGLAAPGRRAVSSRWMLDGDIADETARTGPGDLSHWSEPGPASDSATLPGLTAGLHFFYLEITDDFGGVSLGIVRITAVDAVLDRDLLVVDDTRLEVDKFVSGCPADYTGPWPSATELDTFLCARGGVPWRCARYPAGVPSPPGLLAGYAFDTLGTRLGLADPAQGVPLALLSRYRHVLWLVDQFGAQQAPGSIFPTTALRAMSGPGHASALAAYVALGGRVWLAGGGAAFASLIDWNLRPDPQGGVVFSSFNRELVPGRLIYDAAHIRSALAVSRTSATITRSEAARGGWSGQGPDLTLAAPDYARLPPALRFRTPATDPLPATRPASRASLYYPTVGPNEYVTLANSIQEDFDPDPSLVRLESALDTLYDANSPQLLFTPAPTMLYYHGRENAPFVFSGFDLWSWTRADAQGLVDFVLGDVWGLVKQAPPSPAARAAAVRSTATRANAPLTRRRLDPSGSRP